MQSLFSTNFVMQLAKDYDIRALEELAHRAFQSLEKQQHKGSWADQMPTWRSRGLTRGLLAWGETRKKLEDGTIKLVVKSNAITQLCRHPILKALDFYFHNVGIPPTIAGESLKKAMKNPDYDPDNHERVSRAGHTRKQIVLIPMEPPLGEARNFLEPFLLVTAAAYCNFIDPKIEDGTVSARAVLGFLAGKKVRLQLLANIKNRISRMANRKWLSTCACTLNGWVREGDFNTRLKFFRVLGDPGDVEFPIEGEPLLTCADMVKSMSTNVVSTLVNVAFGRSSSGTNSYGFYPYGKTASTSTDAFLQVSNPSFALTLAEMYPFVFHDKGKWEKMMKCCDHPMTGLWPWRQLNRHLKFGAHMKSNREQLFKTYHTAGGKFHGPEPDAHLPKRAPKRRLIVVNDDDDETDSMDEAFDL